LPGSKISLKIGLSYKTYNWIICWNNLYKLLFLIKI
jgi:hypothetical protein